MLSLRARRISLFAGVVLFVTALALTRGELEAAKKRQRIGARTAITLVDYLIAAVLILRGLARRSIDAGYADPRKPPISSSANGP